MFMAGGRLRWAVACLRAPQRNAKRERQLLRTQNPNPQPQTHSSTETIFRALSKAQVPPWTKTVQAVPNTVLTKRPLTQS